MMIDPFVLLTPVVLLVVIALLRFIGCHSLFGLDEVSAPPPPAPTGLTAKAGNARVRLSWAAYAGASEFKVKRGLTQGGPYQVLASVPGTETSHRDEPVTNGTPYYYVVTAMVSGKESAQSFEANATPMPIGFVQLSRERSEVLSNNRVVDSFAGEVMAENLVVVWIWYNSTTARVASVTDSTGVNVYQRAVGPTRASGFSQEIWYATIVTGGTGLTITATFTNAFNARKSISSHEYAGALAAPENPLDAVADAFGTGAIASSGLATTSFPDELIFGAAYMPGGGTNGADFTKRSALGGHASEDRNVASVGSYEATFTPANPTSTWIAQMVTFK